MIVTITNIMRTTKNPKYVPRLGLFFVVVALFLCFSPARAQQEDGRALYEYLYGVPSISGSAVGSIKRVPVTDLQSSSSDDGRLSKPWTMEERKQLEGLGSTKNSNVGTTEPSKAQVDSKRVGNDDSVRWSKDIISASSIFGVDKALIKAAIKAESSGRKGAVSPAGAVGLMQLMPGTAKMFGVDSHDPYQSILGGSAYLSYLMRVFKNRDLALAAYNAGPSAVIKYHGIPPYKETLDYVKRVNHFVSSVD